MRSMLATLTLAAALTCALAVAQDAPKPWAVTVPFESIAKMENQDIPNGDAPEGRTLTFPEVARKDGYMPVLRFRSRIQHPTPGGWSYYLSTTLNDVALNRMTASGTQRLMNRTPKGTFRDTAKKEDVLRHWWGQVGGKTPCLLIFFGPGGETIDKRLVSDREEQYWYMLDISDGVRYTGAGQDNSLTLTSQLLLKTVRGKSMTLKIEDAEIGYVPVAEWKSRQEVYKAKKAE